MSRIVDLIVEHCPEGVEFRKPARPSGEKSPRGERADCGTGTVEKSSPPGETDATLFSAGV